MTGRPSLNFAVRADGGGFEVISEHRDQMGWCSDESKSRDLAAFFATEENGVVLDEVCRCVIECRDCSLADDWHVHADALCPVHPDARVT